MRADDSATRLPDMQRPGIRSESWMRSHFWWFVALCIVGAVYTVTFTHEFVDFDDPIIFLNNPTLKTNSVDALAAIFDWQRVTDYRPIRDVSHWLDYLIHQQDPMWAHVHQWMLLLLVIFLFSRVLAGLGYGGHVGFVILLLGFLHPVQVEAVAWVSGRKDLLAAIGLFTACWLTIRAFRAPHYLYVAAIPLCMVFGTFSKAHLVVTPIVLSCILIHLRWQGAICRRPWLPWTAVLLSGVVVALLMPRLTQGPANLAPILQKSMETSVMWSDQLQIPLRYILHLVWPMNLNHVYLTTAVDGYHYVLSAFSGFVILVIVGLTVMWCRGQDGRGALLIICGALLMPYLHFIPNTVYMADRYLFCLVPFFITVIVVSVMQIVRSPGWRRGLTSTVIVVLLPVTVQTANVWQNSETLWLRMCSVYPQSDWGYQRLGRYLYRKARYADAAGAFLAAAERDPQDSRHLNNAAASAMALGKNALAIELLRRAIRIDPTNEQAINNLEKLGAHAP